MAHGSDLPDPHKEWESLGTLTQRTVILIIDQIDLSLIYNPNLR